MANPQTIANINGSARIHLEAVKQVDNASKLVSAAVQRVSVQQQKLVESILQVVQTAIHDATENQIRLDSKLADVILMRIASLLDGFKSNLADPISINVQEAKKEILEKLEDVSEGFFSKFIKQYLAQQIVNLIQDPATKDDIEDLKLYLDEVFQKSKVGSSKIEPNDKTQDIATEAAEAVVDRQQILEDRKQKRYEATIDSVSSSVSKLLGSIKDLFTNKVVPAVTSDVQTTTKWTRYANAGFNKVNQGIQSTAQYLKKNVSPQFGILKGVMLTAVLAPLLSIGKDLLGTVGKYALIATGIMFLYNFFKQEKGFFDYLTTDAFGDLAEGWKGIFGFLGDVGSTLWDMFGSLLEPIFKKIGEWIEPKVTEWVNKFISKLDLGNLGIGMFGNLTSIIDKISETLKPISDIMEKDPKKSFFEAVLEWWDSDPNRETKEKVEEKLRKCITNFTVSWFKDEEQMNSVKEAIKKGIGIDLSSISAVLDVLKPLAEEFQTFEQNIRDDEQASKVDIPKSYGDIFCEFILKKFGLKKDTLSQAIQNIADLNVQTINEKLESLEIPEIPDLSGLTSILETFSEKNENGTPKSLDDIISDIWKNFLKNNGLEEVDQVLKKIAKEINQKPSFSEYVKDIIDSTSLGKIATSLFTGYSESKLEAEKTENEKNQDESTSTRTWRIWFKNSGLKAALEAELPEVIENSLESLTKTYPLLSTFLGKKKNKNSGEKEKKPTLLAAIGNTFAAAATTPLPEGKTDSGPEIIKQIQASLNSIDTTIKNLEKITDTIDKTTLPKIDTLLEDTKKLVGNVNNIVDTKIKQILDTINDTTLPNINTAIDKINKILDDIIKVINVLKAVVSSLRSLNPFSCGKNSPGQQKHLDPNILDERALAAARTIGEPVEEYSSQSSASQDNITTSLDEIGRILSSNLKDIADNARKAAESSQQAANTSQMVASSMSNIGTQTTNNVVVVENSASRNPASSENA